MFKLPKKRSDSEADESAEDSVTYEGRSNLPLLKQSKSSTYGEKNVTLDIKKDEDISEKIEQKLIANSTNEDQSFDCKQEEDVPLVFSMKQRRLSKYNFKRDYKTSSAL